MVEYCGEESRAGGKSGNAAYMSTYTPACKRKSGVLALRMLTELRGSTNRLHSTYLTLHNVTDFRSKVSGGALLIPEVNIWTT